VAATAFPLPYLRCATQQQRRRQHGGGDGDAGKVRAQSLDLVRQVCRHNHNHSREARGRTADCFTRTGQCPDQWMCGHTQPLLIKSVVLPSCGLPLSAVAAQDNLASIRGTASAKILCQCLCSNSRIPKHHGTFSDSVSTILRPCWPKRSSEWPLSSPMLPPTSLAPVSWSPDLSLGHPVAHRSLFDREWHSWQH